VRKLAAVNEHLIAVEVDLDSQTIQAGAYSWCERPEIAVLPVQSISLRIAVERGKCSRAENERYGSWALLLPTLSKTHLYQTRR
jgi:hypothetical protein